jgi:hypothetical protein
VEGVAGGVILLQWIKIGMIFGILFIVPLLIPSAMAAGLADWLDPISMVGTVGYLGSEGWKSIRNGMLRLSVLFLLPVLLVLGWDVDYGVLVGLFLYLLYLLMFRAMISSEIERRRREKGGWRYGWY